MSIHTDYEPTSADLTIGQMQTTIGQMQATITSLSKVNAKKAFPNGINYRPPRPLVRTSGRNWVFQPHPELYKTIATNVLKHYACYKSNEIDKTYIPTYFYLGGTGTGKSRHALEFASSVQQAITLDTQHDDYHELTQRLRTPYVFHVSFENGTSLTPEEMSNPWNAIGVRMLLQLLDDPIAEIRSQYDAEPDTIFRLVAAAEGIDLYQDFTGILVVDGIQKALRAYDDGKNRDSTFYGLLGLIGDLSLMSRYYSETEGGTIRAAPFIMTCVTATCFGPVQNFLADSHRKGVYLPLKRLDAPTWKRNSLPVLDNSFIIRLLVDDVGGHARAIELIADELTRDKVQPNIAELADRIYAQLKDRCKEAVSVIRRHILFVVQCVLSRQKIRLQNMIPGSDLRWEDITASGLIWFEGIEADYDYSGEGYLVVPYIWLWMLARQSLSGDTEHLCQFLRDWKFNDYAELYYLATGNGFNGDTTWQSFEVFCCKFRILRSLGFEDGQEVRLESLHSGCKLRDDKKTMVVNRHLNFAVACHQYKTDSMANKRAATSRVRSAEEVETERSGNLDADTQLSYVILNGASAAAGDFFLSIKTPEQRAPYGKASPDRTVHEVGQCKLIRTKTKLNQNMYNAERKKSAGPDDFFILYTQTETSKDCALPDRSGFVDKSCWNSYFGPFAGRAYMALKYSNSED